MHNTWLVLKKLPFSMPVRMVVVFGSSFLKSKKVF